jgi:hypothetical protein
MTRVASPATYSLAQQLARVAGQSIPVLAMNASSWMDGGVAGAKHLLVVRWEVVVGNEMAKDSVLMMRPERRRIHLSLH